MVELRVSLDGQEYLYLQIYTSIATQIRSGQLAPGSRLPGKRSLAARLGVAVNTVDTAYQMLLAEGYLESRQRSGFFVLPYTDMLQTPVEGKFAPQMTEEPVVRFDLSTGSVDTALFPFRTWGRIQKELLYHGEELLHHGARAGDDDLRCAIAQYLRAYRGVECDYTQIVVGAGMEYLLGLVAQLLRGSTAAIENPGYGRSRTILENCGVTCRCVPIDESGLGIDGLEESGANLCYVTPSHHFPTGVTMPIGRRAQLLQWAQRGEGRYIIEDDYDAEFRFDMRPLPSLQGMAGRGGPVIYLCTFSKSLAPSIRIACMVLPVALLPQWREKFGAYANTVSRFEQQTLRRFLEDGHFTRHLSRMRKIYKARMELLCRALEEQFGRECIALRGCHTGLHLLLTLYDAPSEACMVRAAAQEGVRLHGLSEYYMEWRESCPKNTVVIGYASVADCEIPALVAALHRAWGVLQTKKDRGTT